MSAGPMIGATVHSRRFVVVYASNEIVCPPYIPYAPNEVFAQCPPRPSKLRFTSSAPRVEVLGPGSKNKTVGNGTRFKRGLSPRDRIFGIAAYVPMIFLLLVAGFAQTVPLR